jgi:hypothetical protein
MFWLLVIVAVIVFLARSPDARAKLARAVSGEARPDGRPQGHPSTWGWPEEKSGGRRRPRPLPDGRFRTVTGEEIQPHVAEAPREAVQVDGGQVRTAAEVRAEVAEAKDRVKERWRAEQRTRREAGREERRAEREAEEIPAIVYAVESALPPPEPVGGDDAPEQPYATAATVFVNPVPIVVEERRRAVPKPVRVSIPAITRDAPRPARPWDAARERAAARHAAMLAEARARHAAMLAEMRARHRERAERAA